MTEQKPIRADLRQSWTWIHFCWPNPIQSNPWMNPNHVQLWSTVKHPKSEKHSMHCYKIREIHTQHSTVNKKTATASPSAMHRRPFPLPLRISNKVPCKTVVK